MRQDFAITVSQDEKAAFNRDGVVCLRNVLTAEEIERLRAGVARQMAGLGRSATGYDFEVLARRAWDPGTGIDAGAATRFDMAGLKAGVRMRGAAGACDGVKVFDVPGGDAQWGRGRVPSPLERQAGRQQERMRRLWAPADKAC